MRERKKEREREREREGESEREIKRGKEREGEGESERGKEQKLFTCKCEQNEGQTDRQTSGMQHCDRSSNVEVEVVLFC